MTTFSETRQSLEGFRRRHDIDWLRVIGMVVVILVHCARYFDKYGWHVESQTEVPALTYFVNWAGQWVMPMFMLLAGTAAWYALQRRRPNEFLRERWQRLMIPFLAGVFLLSPPQIYLERLTHGQFEGSLWQFLPQYFDGWYGFGGNFAWMGLHLWFLLVLFILALPTQLFSGRLEAFRRLILGIRPRLALLLPLAMLIGIEILVNYFPLSVGRRNFGGWSPLTYAVFYVMGYVLAENPEIENGVRRNWKLGLFLGAFASMLGFLTRDLWYEEYSLGSSVLRAIAAWGYVFGISGAAQRWLGRSNRFLEAAAPAVLPMYILHQPVIVAVGYALLSWQASWWLEYSILLSVSAVLLIGIYWLLLRLPSLSPFFGIRVNS